MATRKTTNISGYPGRTKQPSVLVHIERCAAYGIGFEDSSAKVVNEAERRDDERCRARELRTTVWRRIIPGPELSGDSVD